MPSRKKHSKSRRGCESCKQRRVKCDEQGWPDGPCAACVIRKTVCVFRAASLTIKRARSESHSATKHPSQSNPTAPSLQPDPVETENEQDTSLPSRSERSSLVESVTVPKSSTTIPNVVWSDRIQELQLMHFWTTRTFHIFEMRNGIRSGSWKASITKLMFTNDYLLDIVFALTSVHIATEEVDTVVRSMHVSRALQYQNRAFTPFSKCLENMSPENCDAVLMFTILNMACSTVAGQLPTGDQDQDQVKSPWQSILTLYDAVNAIREILRNFFSWLVDGPFVELYPFMQSDLPVSALDFCRPLTSAEIEGIQTSMRRLRTLTGQIAVEKHPIYSKAIAMLGHYFITSTEHGIGWLALCGSAFVEDVEKEEPVALMLLLHWGVLLRHMSALWWATYSGSRLVERLATNLESRGDSQEWNDAIAWCRDSVASGLPKD